MSTIYDTSAAQLNHDHLVIVDSNGRKMLYEFRGPVLTIGRSAENDIVLSSINVSRIHVKLHHVREGWQIIDTGGVNGTYAGPRRLPPNEPYMLRPLEVISIGEFALYWQPTKRHPHGWNSEPEPVEEEEGTYYGEPSYMGWYVASGMITFLIFLVGLWLLIQVASVPQFIDRLTPQPPTAEERWEGDWLTQCEWLPCGQVTLEHDAEGITGHYLNGTGSLHGVVDGDRLVGVWLLGGASGTFEFTMNEQANAFVGQWDDRWQWCGVQEGIALPAACQ